MESCAREREQRAGSCQRSIVLSLIMILTDDEYGSRGLWIEAQQQKNRACSGLNTTSIGLYGAMPGYSETEEYSAQNSILPEKRNFEMTFSMTRVLRQSCNICDLS